MSRPRISAVIVTRNSQRDIEAALTSLRESSRQPDEVIVIDQSSSDETTDLVRRRFPNAIVLDFWDNPGFGEGNNRAFRIAAGDYLFLLNPDAMAEPTCLEKLAAVLEGKPTVGVAVPKTMLSGEPSVLNSAGLYMNQVGYGWDRGYLEWDHGQYDEPEAVLAGSGCALLLRRSVVRQIGGFDAAYHLYYEDLDLCLRSWLAGYPVQYVPSAVVRHDMKVHARPLVYGEYLDHRNRLRTLAKNLSAASLRQLTGAVIAFEAKSVLGFLRGRRWQAAGFRVAASCWNLAHALSTFRLRRAVQQSRVTSDDTLRSLMTAGAGVPAARAAIPDYPPVYRHSVDLTRLEGRIDMGRNEVGALGLGWHGLETMDGRACRWSCGYGILFLRAPVDSWSGTIRIQCRSTRPLEVLARSVRGDDSRFTLAGATWEEHVIAGMTTDGLIRLELFPQTTLTPAEEIPASRDRRTLGVAVTAAGL